MHSRKLYTFLTLNLFMILKILKIALHHSMFDPGGN